MLPNHADLCFIKGGLACSNSPVPTYVMSSRGWLPHPGIALKLVFDRTLALCRFPYAAA